MAVELELTIGFAANGNALAYLGGGWARAEPEFTWAIGAESHLMLPRGRGECDYVLTLDVVPFVNPPQLPTQRLVVSANDTVVGSCRLDRPALLGYHIPARLTRGTERVVITLLHPDAVRPIDLGVNADDRPLAVSVSEARLFRVVETADESRAALPRGLMLPGDSPARQDATAHREPDGAPDREPDAQLDAWVRDRTGLTLSELAMRFESLGENCEFGLVQRRCEAEPLGLLRFSSTFLRNLIRGLDQRFEALGEPEAIEPRLEGAGPQKEYMIHERRYGLVYHTFVYEGQRSPWLMREQESVRLKFLRRKFLEELALGEKIFVYKRNIPAEDEEILPLCLALASHGPGWVLWVVSAENGPASGTVEVVGPRLLKAYIDRFASDDAAHDFSFEAWVRICVNAWLLSKLKIG
jgi:hypothetical protein